MASLLLPPLSLYVHIPWCVQKCPYCDFNSHGLKGEIPEQDYIEHLLADLQADIMRFKDSLQNRPLHSIFIGGGTPSLFSAESIAQLLSAIQQLIPFQQDIEVTLEANPGTVEAERFHGYVNAGITRISMGIQSFSNEKLVALGRIHNVAEAKSAVEIAKISGLKSFNVDLMHGLPNQTLEQALDDLRQAIELSPPHLSWYQLTIEPNTMFASRPPKLPDDDELWDIFEQGHQLLTAAGYQQYETSAYAKPGFQCQHNLNYWRFGDYLAIGCGAHGKMSFQNGEIIRYSKTRHPKGYLRGEYLYEERQVADVDRPFEFFMNRFRLLEIVPKSEFRAYTGLSESTIAQQINWAVEQNYIIETETTWQITEHGKLFLNELLEAFLVDE
ncbi:radical SAM family heme chaperone HemW [Pasteurella bettyae]|uniref:Heme chaperone HemW n=1 Tax=Pasteurella bettyae CCUG 2042 TaxID=1095749 RepID=I3DFC5_9PAST|nr:radical SAM family heme chaperone HemW [Pasteurella bettyae]EIJ70418.1 putative coproporphyrinogen dehydrogenase [Pasteurella bettyae CCUG 2042]SUB21044.1 oxygen-independent coproporphyrinogen-III oxidase-like protein [Pasteurella bettyae]